MKKKKKEDGADDDQSFMDVLQRTRAITASLSLSFSRLTGGTVIHGKANLPGKIFLRALY